MRDYQREHCQQRLMEYRDRAIEHLRSVQTIHDTGTFEKACIDLENALAYVDYGMQHCPISLRVNYRD